MTVFMTPLSHQNGQTPATPVSHRALPGCLPTPPRAGQLIVLLTPLPHEKRSIADGPGSCRRTDGISDAAPCVYSWPKQ